MRRLELNQMENVQAGSIREEINSIPSFIRDCKIPIFLGLGGVIYDGLMSKTVYITYGCSGWFE